MLAAKGAEFFENKFFLVLFFVFSGSVVHSLTSGTSKFDKIFGYTSHKKKLKLKNQNKKRRP